MAEKNTLIEKMLEHLVNDDQQKAEELFHEYVVSKSREIYENMIDSEMEDYQETDEDFAAEADDEMDLDTADPTDDLASELDSEEGEEGEEEFGGEEEDLDDKSDDELFQDLDDIHSELEARFQELRGGGDNMGGMGDETMKDDFDLETVREYVEKVPAGHGVEKKGQAEKADGSAAGMKFSKNDMGGKPMKFGAEDNSSKGTTGGLANNKPQDMKTGNLNAVGGYKGDAFKKNSAGHGAEKKGSAEGSTDGQSLFRGRR
jgi:hypothetical protein